MRHDPHAFAPQAQPIGDVLRQFVIAMIERETDPAERIERIRIAASHGHITDQHAARWIEKCREG